MKTEEKDFRMVATTMFGLEEILTAELLKLGARDIEKYNRAVSFTGDSGFMYKANFCLRTALRVLKPIANFQADDSTHLYKQIKKIEWEKYLSENGTLAVDAAVNSETFTHSQFVSQRVKDAVCDRFREIANDVRPSVDLDFPDVRINIHIVKNTCTVSLDSSGYSLHKRGYRDSTGIAPMNEVLAAGLVLLSGWDKSKTLVDPMCGSGTIAFEAAMMAANIPPGYYREKFGFEKWKDFDAELFEIIREKIIDKITDYPASVFASDLSANNIKKAKQNSKFAKVDDMVKFSVTDFLTLEKPAPSGVIIMNPPYGERMDKDDLVALYKQIGDRLKKHWTGYEAWIISSNIDAINKIGLRHSRRIALFNGKLECKFLKYEMYEGAKKDKYINQ